MSGIVWNLVSTAIGAAIGGGGSKAIKNLPTSLPTNAITGALGGLVTSFFSTGKIDLVNLLTIVVGSVGLPAVVNLVMNSLVKPAN